MQIVELFDAHDNEDSAMFGLLGFVCLRCCYISFAELWVAEVTNWGRYGLFFLFYRFGGTLF